MRISMLRMHERDTRLEVVCVVIFRLTRSICIINYVLNPDFGVVYCMGIFNMEMWASITQLCTILENCMTRDYL